MPLASMCIKWPGCLSKNRLLFGAWFRPTKISKIRGHQYLKNVLEDILKSQILHFEEWRNSMLAPKVQEAKKLCRLLHQTKLSMFEFICPIKNYCCTSAKKVLLEAASHGQRRLQNLYILASNLQIFLGLCSLWQSANQWQAGLAVVSLSAWWEDSVESTKSFVLHQLTYCNSHLIQHFEWQAINPLGASLRPPLRLETHWKCPQHRTPAIPNTRWSPERQCWVIIRT